MLPTLPLLLVLRVATVVWSLTYSFPIWVALFYVPRVPNVKLFALTAYVAHAALESDGWSANWMRYVLSAVCGGLLNLAHSAFWDALEPKIIGKEGFGQGKARAMKIDTNGKPMDPQDLALAQSIARVTAASSIASGDPAKGAAAAAFTQSELDILASKGIRPWDPAAQAALKRLS